MKTRCWRRISAIVSVWMVVSQPVFAWNNLGHMTIAKIAYDRLSVPERERFGQILANHPHYHEYLIADCPAEVAPQEWAFLKASTWSDWIRPPRDFAGNVTEHPRYKYHRGPWHYVNFPYQPPNSPASLPHELPADTHILKQITACQEILGGRMATDPGAVLGVTAEANMAVRLCWISHLVGDLHQPLHAVAMINEQRFPAPHFDDQGGNRIVIRTSDSAQPNRLHAFWDQLMGFDAGYPNITSLARDLTSRPQMQPAALRELGEHSKLVDWAEESYRLAISHAYLNGQLPIALSDEFFGRRIAAQDVPVLPPGVEANAKQVAERRIVLAGYRFANLLKSLEK